MVSDSDLSAPLGQMARSKFLVDKLDSFSSPPLSPKTLKYEVLDADGRSTGDDPSVDPKNSESVADDETDSKEMEYGEEFQDRVDATLRGANMPYDPFNEPLPSLPAYHPSIAKVEQYCKEIVKHAADLLSYAGFKHARISVLQQKASDSRDIIYPPPLKIGLFGDSGVGKSSLINALLDTPDIAACGYTGAAMTCCVTEYHQAPPSQRAPFMATIIFYKSDSIRQILNDHIASFYQFHFCSKDELDQESLDEMNALSTTASDVFKSLYADHEDFKDEDTIGAFLRTATSGSDSVVLGKLYDWAQELIAKNNGQNGLIYVTGDTPDQLAQEIERFVKPCSALLEHGLILADLPGLSDVNKMRTRQTTAYMKRCKYGLLVAPIGRVQTDDLVHKRLGELYRIFGDQKALLMTKIDDMPLKTKPSDLDASTEAVEEHTQLNSAIKTLKPEKTRLTNLMKKAQSKARHVITQQITDVELRKKIYEALKRESLVAMRNHKVTAIMRKKYVSITDDRSPLMAFSVSSSDYERHKEEEGYGCFGDFLLSIVPTGIPHVRMQLLALPAEGRLNAIKSYTQGVVEDLLGSIHNWSIQDKMQRSEELEILVARPRNNVEREVDLYTEELASLLEKQILQKSRDRIDSWIQNSVRLFDDWTSSWHPSTYAAWCRHDGVHKTKKQRHYSWNAELLSPVVKDLEPAWGLFGNGVRIANERCIKIIISLIQNIGNDLADEGGNSLDALSAFLKSHSPKQARVRKSLEDFSKVIEKASRITMLNVTMGNRDSEGYLLKVMLPIYEKCGNLTGRNMHPIRSALLTEAASKGEPFNAMTADIEKAIKGKIRKRRPSLLKSLQAVFDDIIADFNSLFVIEETPGPTRDILQAQMQGFVQQAYAKMNGPVATELVIGMNASDGNTGTEISMTT